MEPVELVHMSICQGNTYRKDLSWLHFDDDSRECHLLSPSIFFLQRIIRFSIFPGFDDKTLSLLQVLFSLSIAVEIYMIMYICTCAYAYAVYTHMYAYACMGVSVCECVYIYTF